LEALMTLRDVTELKIGRDTLLAISAIAWADGTLDPREAEALRQAARQLQMQGEDLASIERALGSVVTLEEVETVRMNRLTRLFTYATACWVAEVDGQQSPAEGAMLALLGDRLGLSAIARDRAHDAVRGVTSRSAPGGFDLLELRSRLSAGLSQIGDE
jgi:tellurite resistance protein